MLMDISYLIDECPFNGRQGRRDPLKDILGGLGLSTIHRVSFSCGIAATAITCTAASC
jgi:hypothetical protein